MLDKLQVPVYVIRHEDTSALKEMGAIVSSFVNWAKVSGETDDSLVFAEVAIAELVKQGTAQVQLYPELELAADGEYLFDRRPDAVKTLSPFHIARYDINVTAARVPKETALVVLVGKEVRDPLERFDFTELCSDAQSGARVFDIETMASEGQDGVSGLVMSALAAAANLPDTDMWNFSQYRGEDEDTIMIVFSD